MCVQGELAAADGLSPFQEMDGVLLVDSQLRIIYLSGIANNLYRRLGYVEDLRGGRSTTCTPATTCSPSRRCRPAGR